MNIFWKSFTKLFLIKGVKNRINFIGFSAGSPMSYQWCYTSESPVFTHPCSYYVDLNTSQEIFLPNNSYPPTFTPVQYPDISPINSVSKKLLYNDYSTSEINHQKKVRENKIIFCAVN